MIDLTDEELEMLRRLVYDRVHWLEDTPNWAKATDHYIRRRLSAAKRLAAKIGEPNYAIDPYDE